MAHGSRYLKGTAIPRLFVLPISVLGAANSTSAQSRSVSSSATPTSEPRPTRGVPTPSDASTGIGSAVRWPLLGPVNLEAETGYRRTNLSPYHTKVMISLDLPQVGRAEPYVSGGIGIDHYASLDGKPLSNLVLRMGVPLTFTTAAGVRVRLDDERVYRAELRWNKGIGGRPLERWRLYNGITIGSRR
jgi:hypothetical protein